MWQVTVYSGYVSLCVHVCVCVTNIEQKHPETPTDCISKMDAACESLVGKPIRSRASLRVFKALWNSEPENLTSGTEKKTINVEPLAA